MKPVVLIVLDGWGYSEQHAHNALSSASLPFYNSLLDTYPHSLLAAAGGAIGLPEGQIGTSEIGHLTIGAGSILDADLVRISKSIRLGEFHGNPAFLALFDHVKKHNSTLHIQGLLSPGGVHSHQEHLHGFLEAAKEQGVEKIAVHAFTDGRDTLPQSGHTYLAELEAVLQDVGIGFIATASGRFYAMDRDNNWDRVEKVEAALFEGKGVLSQGKKPSAVMKELHATGVVDEHLEPVVFLDERGNSYRIAENDGVFFFNFRPDRARMLAQKIATRAKTHNLCFVTLTEYDKSIQSIVAFPPKTQETSLAAEIAKAGLSQVHIAETEKYAHATYFLNGGQEEPHERETHVLVESRKDVRTHDLAPEMQAEEITTKALQFLPHTDFVFINYANADMVGHTANFEAALKAVETIDQQLARLVPKVLEQGGVVCITADHGNAEQLVDPKTGSKYTAHTANPVPFIVTTKGGKLENGTLADVAPTVLKLLHLPQPAAMTGKNLLVK